MTFPGRRVVTGHDHNGHAIVRIDDIPSNVISRRVGHSSAVLWTTHSSPADNDDASDAALRPVDGRRRTARFFASHASSPASRLLGTARN